MGATYLYSTRCSDFWVCLFMLNWLFCSLKYFIYSQLVVPISGCFLFMLNCDYAFISGCYLFFAQLSLLIWGCCLLMLNWLFNFSVLFIGAQLVIFVSVYCLFMPNCLFGSLDNVNLWLIGIFLYVYQGFKRKGWFQRTCMCYLQVGVSCLPRPRSHTQISLPNAVIVLLFSWRYAFFVFLNCH